MTAYTCPNCMGGFPDNHAKDGCPWCDQHFHEYDAEGTQEVVHRSAGNRTENGGDGLASRLGFR